MSRNRDIQIRRARRERQRRRAQAKQVAAVLVGDVCAYCGDLAQGNYSIHRDGFDNGPEVPLCDQCGDHTGPSLLAIWSRIAHT